MISQMVRNENLRFGRHIDIEVNYKILWLEISKLILNLHYSACFQKGLFGGNFEQKHPWSFKGYLKINGMFSSHMDVNVNTNMCVYNTNVGIYLKYLHNCNCM